MTFHKIIHEYNSFDLLTKTKVINDSNEILNNTYAYNTISTVLTPQVKIEAINNDVYQYEYDVRGNVKTIEKNDVILHQYTYDELGNLYGFIYNNEKYYYIKNIFNTILGIVDSTGNDIVKYNYDARGNILSLEDNSTDLIGTINLFIYKGYYYDSETGYFGLPSRYYSPELCRWILPDSIEYLDLESINGLNLYCYCMNNPIMYADPSGHMPEWLSTTLKIIGAAAGGIGAGISTAVPWRDIHDFGNAFLMGTATGAISGATAASPH